MLVLLGVVGLLVTIYYGIQRETKADKEAQKILWDQLEKDIEKMEIEHKEEAYQDFKKNMDRYNEEKNELL